MGSALSAVPLESSTALCLKAILLTYLYVQVFCIHVN